MAVLTWSDERVEQLKKLLEAGLSTSKIAAELGGGISRNAVIGKVHRLGLTGRAKPAPPEVEKVRRRTNGRKVHFTRRQPVEEPQEREEIPPDFDPSNVSAFDAAIPVERRKGLLDLQQHHCRWPVGDPQLPDFFFCGGTAEEGRPYCALHCRVAFTPAGQRAAERAAMSPAERAIRIAQGRGVLGVRRWDETSGTVTGRANATTGAFSVADPREIRSQDFHGLRVNNWKGTAAAVTTQRSPGSSAQSVADPRIDGHEKSVQLGVGHWDQPSSVVKGDVSVGTGRYAVADPRLERKVFNSTFRIVAWPEHSPAVAGPGGAGGGLAVADPRPAQRDDYKQTKYRVTGYDEASGAVIGASTTGTGAFAVADPRHHNWHPGASSSKERVTGWTEHARPVTGSQQVASGAGAVADPRPGFGPHTHHHVLKVTDWEQPGGTVTASSHPSGGALSVADPRLAVGARNSALGVNEWDGPAGVAGESNPTNGAFAVADPRPEALSDERRNAYLTGGHYGVVPWDQHSGAVPAHAKNNNGPWSSPTHDIPATVPRRRLRHGTSYRPRTTSWYVSSVRWMGRGTGRSRPWNSPRYKASSTSTMSRNGQRFRLIRLIKTGRRTSSA
ncbi:GcrA family cell cycle regulator [Bradyrhizobium sp. Leo170]|uniref:GcrA family cell cycle regulator n=1 Tax=Bradyrhizobium sp. Leo170 TaxID=1571199 RepID=UPI0032E45F31